MVIVESTSIPLAVLMILFVYSGYGLVSPVMGDYGFTYYVSTRIHASRELRLLLVALTYLHGVAGLNILVYRAVKNSKLRLILEIVVVLAALITLIPIVHAETTLLKSAGRGRR